MTETLIKPATLKKKEESFNRCSDYDDECHDVPCKVSCWLYDPTKGLCLFLYTGDSDER